MALSDPRIVFGIHSMSPYRRSDGMPYGILKVIGSANLELTGELEQLYAGSNKFPWAAESKTISASVSMAVKAYPGFLFELFLGATVTDVTTPDTDGVVSALTNKLGSTVFSGTIGIASVAAIPSTGPANLKFGKYIVKALSASTAKIYALSDIDFARGTDLVFVDDTLEVGSLTITTGANSDVAALGLRFVGGSGVIAMVAGDTALFEVQPPFTKSSEIIVGKTTSTFPEFGALFLAAKRASGEMFEIDAAKCSATGMPISLEETAFSQPELNVVLQYDSALDRVFTIRNINPS